MSRRKTIGIIGGGASGMMAAVAAARLGRPALDVIILEKKDRIGKKLLATGNGKCNLTNLDFEPQKPERYYRGTSVSQLRDCFGRFGVQDTLRLFEEMGMLVTEKNGYVYPLSQQAASVLDALRFELEHLGVRIITDCGIEKIRDGGQGGFRVRMQTQQQVQTKQQMQQNGELYFDRLILACGTPAGLKAGEGTDGYRFAAQMGHRVIPPVPALVQLRCRGGFWKTVAGVRVDAAVEMTTDAAGSRQVYRERGEVQLTDYGISGIPVFQLSRYASAALAAKGSVRVSLDFLPGYEGREQEWEELCRRRLAHYEGRQMEELFGGLVNKKIMQMLMKEKGLKPQELLHGGNRKAAAGILHALRRFEVQVQEANPFQNAQVCAGGVPLSEVTRNLESRLKPGLYLTGELLDVDAICGGYNLQWAWTSGYLAGCAAAEGLVRENR